MRILRKYETGSRNFLVILTFFLCAFWFTERNDRTGFTAWLFMRFSQKGALSRVALLRDCLWNCCARGPGV